PAASLAPSATLARCTRALPDALPIWAWWSSASRGTTVQWVGMGGSRGGDTRQNVMCNRWWLNRWVAGPVCSWMVHGPGWIARSRSEEHTSELQARENLVCRLLLEKKE